METGIMEIHLPSSPNSGNERTGRMNAHFSGSEELHSLGHLEAIADQVLQSERVLVEII